jgi:hypothetical protein
MEHDLLHRTPGEGAVPAIALLLDEALETMPVRFRNKETQRGQFEVSPRLHGTFTLSRTIRLSDRSLYGMREAVPGQQDSCGITLVIYK